MNYERHKIWLIMLGVAALLFGGVWPYLSAQKSATQAELAALRQQNATALLEARSLQRDVAEETALRHELGDKTFNALFAPPPRAQLVAALRQMGLATGLHDFALTMDQATWLTPESKAADPAENLTATALHIKATAPDDRSIYSFAAQALEQLPGYLKLDRLTVTRQAGTPANPVIVQGELDLRWLSLNEDLLFARKQP